MENKVDTFWYVDPDNKSKGIRQGLLTLITILKLNWCGKQYILIVFTSTVKLIDINIGTQDGKLKRTIRSNEAVRFIHT